MRLAGPLGSYVDRDEFQIGQMLIWVKYSAEENRTLTLQKAEATLSLLEQDIPLVEELAAKSKHSTVTAQVIGLLINPDGSASYECTFFDGAHEDELVCVGRKKDGGLFLERT